MSAMKFSDQMYVRRSCAVLLAVCFVSLTVDANEVPVEDGRIAARSAVNEFGTTLKAALGGALATGDLIAALDVCSDQAPQMAATVSAQSGITVGRTSEKPRNSANSPTDWQLAVLREWRADKDHGKDISKREFYVEQPGGGFRYMRPILIKPPCLTCHGETQSAELKAALEIRYPDDRATGYKLGDLRGAFVAQK
ncbi:MAG: hypothetical protein DRQ89_14850 [Epsilonproteobacteria bacterium]|nr:MAG: hypothetical protein DRQ89_14850 [Campylobacterota bacterium]